MLFGLATRAARQIIEKVSLLYVVRMQDHECVLPHPPRFEKASQVPDLPRKSFCVKEIKIHFFFKKIFFSNLLVKEFDLCVVDHAVGHVDRSDVRALLIRYRRLDRVVGDPRAVGQE